MAPSVTSALVPFLGRLSPEGARVVQALAVKKVQGTRVLLRRGDPVDGAYFVVGGAFRVYYLTPEGREATLYRVEPGETCVLALTATFNQTAYPAWVESGPRGAAFLQLPGQALQRLYDTEPEFRRFIFHVLAGRIFDLMSTLEEVGSARVEQRLARLLLREARDGTVRTSQARLAAELGTAREVVSRAVRSLKATGVVGGRRLELRVLRPEALRAVAQGRST